MNMKENAVRGVVFNIQRFSIHDGPGIRTTVFLKGCPLRCFWCQNPESQKKGPEILLFKDKCTLCGHCVDVCPISATSLSPEGPVIDRNRCTGCGECSKACPNEARQVSGEYMTADEVMEEVMKDISFYNNSGGGITLSGGDPIAQSDFALAVLKASKDSGLHTTLDTTGYTNWPTMEKLLTYTDLVLFDIKHIDDAKHIEGTERSNALIIDNARQVAKTTPMRIRVPLIPGFNDSVDYIRRFARFVKEEIGPLPIDLHPYNQLGEPKYERLNKTCQHFSVQSDDYIQRLRDIIDSEIPEDAGVPSQTLS